MRILFLAAALCLTAPLSACAAGGGAAAEAEKTAIVTIDAGTAKHRFRVEVARTPEEQRQGLMYRTDIPADGGMIFPFPKPRIASFWMKNTLVPLDMIFIRADGSIDRIAENTIPESLEPVVSGGDVVAVLELAGGTASRLGFDDSATVRWTGGK
jgi:uncharacterized membrane protein (UPF0127 family)